MDNWGRDKGGHFKQRRIREAKLRYDKAGLMMSCEYDWRVRFVG